MRRTSRIFAEGDFFHVFNKSIAGFQIFKDVFNIKRFINTLEYYNENLSPQLNLSRFMRANKDYSFSGILNIPNSIYVKILAYCIMPDHYHLLVKIQKEDYFSHYMSVVENSFSRYFNVKFNRKGPLWQSRFKAVLIESNEELLHVSRYIHLNPVTSSYVDKPEEWEWSSYRSYLQNMEQFQEISISNPAAYKKFVEDNIDYQRQLKEIKRHLLD